MKRERAMSPTTTFSMVGVLLEFCAEDGVEAAHEEEGGHDGDVDEIIHTLSFACGRGAAS
jgi:hypothetical protein